MKQRKTPKTDPAEAAPAGRDGTRPTTTQDMAEGFNDYAKSIKEICSRFAYRPDDRELVALYDTWRRCIGSWRSIALKHVADTPPLPELPRLTDSDFYASMVRLEDFCAEAAKRLCAAPVVVRSRKADAFQAAILAVFQDRPEADKASYLKAAEVHLALKERCPNYTLRCRTLKGKLTELANAEILDSKQRFGFRLPPQA